MQMEPKRHNMSSQHTGSTSHHVTFQHLKDITHNFGDEKVLGRGGYSVVYKGDLQSGEVVAVKKILRAIPSSQKQFENELNLLLKLEHPNIVRLVSYCYETQHLEKLHEGKIICARNTECSLCLEYLSKGCLNNYISGASSGLDWGTRWKIIRGISFGLCYLHEQFNGPIIHLDLKPSNILLDENWLPKIADFGLSRLYEEKPTISNVMTSGTLGYMPPEYLLEGIATPKSDIFSLGVIIMEVITGQRNYPYDIGAFSEEFIVNEVQKWRNVLENKMDHASLEFRCQQIKGCIQIALMCVNPEWCERPTMNQIVDKFEELESINLLHPDHGAACYRQRTTSPRGFWKPMWSCSIGRSLSRRWKRSRSWLCRSRRPKRACRRYEERG